MKYLSRILLVATFALSAVLFSAQAGPAKSQGEKSSSNGSKMTYLSISKDLVKSKANLSKKEKRIVNAYISGKNSNIRDLRYLESAFKKHPCFIDLKGKRKNLTMFPRKNSTPNWFALDCSKPSNKKGNKAPGKKPAGIKK